jgi:flagellar basal body-associated protein FliL
MFGFDFESLKMDFSNPMLWAGLVLMVVAIIGYFWMTSKKEESQQQPYSSTVSFAPTEQVMEIPSNSQEAQQQYQEPQQQFEDQPTVATCIVNESGEQVCA